MGWGETHHFISASAQSSCGDTHQPHTMPSATTIKGCNCKEPRVRRLIKPDPPGNLSSELSLWRHEDSSLICHPPEQAWNQVLIFFFFFFFYRQIQKSEGEKAAFEIPFHPGQCLITPLRALHGYVSHRAHVSTHTTHRVAGSIIAYELLSGMNVQA